jgi:cytochrome c-type biogenesis protein CcmH/NrfF
MPNLTLIITIPTLLIIVALLMLSRLIFIEATKCMHLRARWQTVTRTQTKIGQELHCPDCGKDINSRWVDL